MYKNTVLFCTLVSLVNSNVIRPVRPKDQEIFHLKPETVVNVQKFTLPCIEKYNADPDIFKKLIDGTMSDDETSKNFLLCFAVSGKFTFEDGHFNIPRMASFIGEHKKIKEFHEALGECNKITKENPRETVYAMSICINEKSPVAFSL